MTIKQFPPRGQGPEEAPSIDAGKESSAESASPTPANATDRPKSVTLFQGDSYALNFSGTRMQLAISPKALEQNGAAQAPHAVRPSSNERDDILDLLSLDDEVVRSIDAIAQQNDLTFGEALRFHLVMTLPG